MRVAPPVEISAEERTTLDDWANGRQTEVRAAERARVILPAADGKPNLEIDTTLSTSVQQAAHWRWRFLAKDLPGLEKNAPRPRRFPSIASQKVAEVVRLTTLDKPAHATYWSNRSVANKVGMLRTSVLRICHDHGSIPICPRLSRSAMTLILPRNLKRS